MTLALGAASVHCHIQNISYSTELGKYFHVKEGRITTCVISPCFNHNKQRRIRLFLPARTPFPIIFQMVLWQTDSPRPGVDGQAKPRWVRRGRRFGNHYHLFPSLVAGLKKFITGTQKHIQQAYGTSAPACVRCLFFFNLPCKCRCGCHTAQSSGSDVWLRGRVLPSGDSCSSYSLSWRREDTVSETKARTCLQIFKGIYSCVLSFVASS